MIELYNKIMSLVPSEFYFCQISNRHLVRKIYHSRQVAHNDLSLEQSTTQSLTFKYLLVI